MKISRSEKCKILIGKTIFSITIVTNSQQSKQLKDSKTGWLAYPILINKEAEFSRKNFKFI